MKKKESSNYRSYINKTKFYLEDLEEIIELLKEDNLEIQISDAENIYESLAELKEIKGKSINEININARDKNFNQVDLSLKNGRTSLLIFGHDKLGSIGYKLDKAIHKRKKSWYNSFFSSSNARLNIIIIFLVMITFRAYAFYKEESFSFKPWILFIGMWTIIWIYGEFNPATSENIELERKHETNLYQRNKDKILIGLIMAAIGAIITLAITRYFKIN